MSDIISRLAQHKPQPNSEILNTARHWVDQKSLFMFFSKMLHKNLNALFGVCVCLCVLDITKRYWSIKVPRGSFFLSSLSLLSFYSTHTHTHAHTHTHTHTHAHTKPLKHTKSFSLSHNNYEITLNKSIIFRFVLLSLD